MNDNQTTGPAPNARPVPPGVRPDPRASAEHVDCSEHLALKVPCLGTVRLPPPDQLAYYTAVAALLALEVIEWPVALLVAAGHAVTQQHSRTREEFGAPGREPESFATPHL